MPQRPPNISDHFVEAAKVCAAILFLFFAFNDLSGDLLFRNLLMEWHWGRFLTIALAYWFAKEFFQVSTQKMPLWKCLLCTFYGASVITLIVWAGFGTHIEDADPLFGGGTRVVDFVPTAIERDLVGSRLFVDILLPGLFGTYLARRERTGRPMPSWFAGCVRWVDFGIKSSLNIVVTGAVWVGMVVVSGFVVWGMGSAIIERAEIGWYLLWAIPFLLFSGAGFLLLGILMPLEFIVGLRESTLWKRLTRSRSDKGEPPT